MKKVYLCFFIMLLINQLNSQDSLWTQVNNESQLSQKALLLESIFEKYKYQDISVSDSSARFLIEISGHSNSDTLQAKGYFLLAKAKLIQSQYDSCSFFIDKGWSYLEGNLKTSNQAAYLHKLRALLHYYQGEYKYSLEENFKALEIWKTLNNQVDLPTIYNNIGICYERLNENKIALRYYRQGLDVIPKSDVRKKAIFLNNIAIILINQEQLEEAEEMLLEGKKIAEKINYTSLIIDISGSLSEIYFTQKKYNKGIEIALENIDRLKKSEDYFRLVRNLNMLGDQYNLIDSPAKAIVTLQEAADLASKYSIGEHKMEVYENMVVSYKMLGNYKFATTVQDSFIKYNQQRFNKEKNLITEELNIKYETAQKNQALLISDQDLWKRTIQRNILIVGLMILFGFLYLLWMRYKQKAEVNQQKIYIQKQKIKQMEEEKKTLSLTYILEGQEVERNRIAQDLHDGLGGLLASVKNHFSLIQEEIVKLENLSIYDRTNNMIDQACSEVRRISHNLMPTGLKIHGLQSTVQELCNSLQDEHTIPIKFETMGIVTNRLPESIEIFVYRIIQEGLNNCIKHAKAKHILVQLGFYNKELQLVIEDDGIGFDPSKETDGIGMHSMVSRVQFLNGVIDIDSKIGSGTTISINIPNDE